MKKNVLKELYLQWDGTHTNLLKEVYEANCSDTSFIPLTITLFAKNNELEVSTTWILKHHVEKGGEIAANDLEQLLKRGATLRNWESQLHFLQIIPKISLSKKQAEQLEPSIRPLLFSDKKFVKAAAFTAYFEVVKLIPELQNEFRLICEDALEKSSASVKVRIRRILQNG
ncbi:hypothetical protein [Cyclobacterium plantarum]|uniref:HEAT repeat domain-containing protein n=1 Tax=Cyclobacterium plantarum TaxID=2716263 RepID=A0ABX0HDV8_9BACT|nr:hypothetical protein [Cyclobacterium plantarum]NHE59934.1 hypothetical protein [Cyclobacterium plantarum]